MLSPTGRRTGADHRDDLASPVVCEPPAEFRPRRPQAEQGGERRSRVELFGRLRQRLRSLHATTPDALRDAAAIAHQVGASPFVIAGPEGLNYYAVRGTSACAPW